MIDRPFIALHAESSLRHLLNRAAAELGKDINLRIQVTSFDAVCAMVVAGLGISVVPRAAASPYVQSMRLVAIPLSDTWAQRQLILCTRSGALHAAAQLLFDHLNKTGSL